ncbi:unnamed protein product [Ophioblennius macclurei]
MDKVSDGDVGEATGSDLTSPPIPPKQPRKDYAVMDDHRGKSKSDFPALLTFPKTISSPSALSGLQKSEELICVAKYGGFRDENPYERAQDGKLNVTPVTEVTPSHGKIAHAESPRDGFIASGRQPPALSKIIETSVPGDDAGDCSAPNQPGESLEEEETPGDCSIPSENEQAERNVQVHEEVTRRSDCAQKESHSNVGSADAASDEKRDERQTSDSILIEEDGNRLKLPCDHADYTNPYPNSEEETNGNSSQAGKCAKTCEKESVSVCDLETKSRANESDWRDGVLYSTAACAEGSILVCNVVSDRNTAAENARFEVDDFHEAKGASAAGEIIAGAPSSEKADHTAETAAPAEISREPAERDNDADSFGVIDLAIWSETGRRAEEGGQNSESAAGGGLSPSVNAHEMEAPDVRASPSPDGRDKDEDEDFCLARFFITDNNTTSSENSLRREIGASGGSPPETHPAPPAGDDGKQESDDTVGRRLKEQGASSRFPGGPDRPQWENDTTADIKDNRESLVSDERQSSASTEILAFSDDQAESETHQPENKFKVVEEERGSVLPFTVETLENCDEMRENEHAIQVAQGSPSERKERNEAINQELDCEPTADCKKNLSAFASCAENDAPVASQHDFSLQQDVSPSSSDLNGNGRFSPLTSVFALRGGFDTFEKIQLSLSDDDDDDDNVIGLDDLARVPVLTNSPRLQLPEEEAEEREETGFGSGASSCDKLPNFIPIADVIAAEPPCRSSDRQRQSDSPAVSDGSGAPSSDANVCSRFEMQTQFDTVLKELHLFFDISRNELADYCGDVDKPQERNTSERRRPRSPEVERRHRDASSDDADEDHSLEIRGCDRTVGRDGEQEVPLSSHLCRETPEDSEERLETQQKRKPWSPSFGSEPLFEQLCQKLLEPPRRLERLKTCTRPRRLGLSKRARIKPLHRLHPYK